MAKKISWRKEREEEISCDYQNRIDARNSDVREKLESIRNHGLADLKEKLETMRTQSLAALQAKLESIQKKHEASLNRMRENYELQLQKLRGGR